MPSPSAAPFIDRLISGLSEWQIYALVIGLFLQGVVIAFAPEEVLIMSLGVLWVQGRVRFPLALLAAAFGLLAANAIIVFVAGRFSHLSIFQKKAVHQALERFRSNGKWIVFFTRFTPFVRAPVYYAAGISGMPVSRFFRIDALAFCFHAPAVFLIGAWIGTKTGSITEAYKVIVIVAVSTASLLVSGALIKKKLRPDRATPASTSIP